MSVEREGRQTDFVNALWCKGKQAPRRMGEGQLFMDSPHGCLLIFVPKTERIFYKNGSFLLRIEKGLVL